MGRKYFPNVPEGKRVVRDGIYYDADFMITAFDDVNEIPIDRDIMAKDFDIEIAIHEGERDEGEIFKLKDMTDKELAHLKLRIPPEIGRYIHIQKNKEEYL